MKMSDVFALPLKHDGQWVDDIGCTYQWVVDANGNDVSSDTTAPDYNQTSHVVKAINMHDQLVNQLEELLAQAKKLDNIIDMCSGTWAQSEVTNEQDLFSALVSSAETLLTKAKGE